ncbi:MAG: N-6 DNA methylase [Acidobacteriaceae bacterium]
MTDQQDAKTVRPVTEVPKTSDTTLAAFIWKNAEDLWGDFKHTDFGKIILPFTLLRRLECVLEPTRDAVRKATEKFKSKGLDIDLILRQTAGLPFYNTSLYSLATLGATKTKSNLDAYIAGFSDNARVIFEQFNFTDTIARLARADILFKICQNFANTDLHPNVVPDRVMSNIYEHLIRRFGAAVNEAAEDFMTPRDVVHLATTLLLDPDDALFRNNPGLIRTLYDPTCGTGGFLTDAMNHVDGYTAAGKAPPVLIPFGQELEPETHAVALANMLLRRLETEPSRDLSANIAGPKSALSQDAFAGKHFHYCLSNPPFGKKWEKDQAFVEREAKEKGFDGRFGAGTPRVSDGSMLFIQHLIDKLERPANGGGRAAIILSGSPLFTSNAGQGESEIRRWLLENDYIEAIVALPNDIFFRTGIGTYVWLLTNKKTAAREGKVQLIDGTGFHSPMRKSEGNKRRYINDEQIQTIARLYADFEAGENVRIVNFRDFGYRRIRVQRPLRLSVHVTDDALATLQASKTFEKLDKAEQTDWLALLRKYLGQTHPYIWLATLPEAAKKAGLSKTSKAMSIALEGALGVRDPQAPEVRDEDGELVPDKELEDFENVPLDQHIDEYFTAEVLPHVPDAWVESSYVDDRDRQVGKVGFEINFNRYFYNYVPPRDLHGIEAELKAVETEIAALREEIITLATCCQIEESTRWARLKHVSDLVSRPVKQVASESYTRLGLYNRGRGIFKKEAADSDDMGDSDFYWVEDGDLILSGQFAWEGAVAMARVDHAGCVVSHRYPIIRGKEGEALSEYLLAFFLTPHGDFVLNDCSRGSAGRNRPLNVGLLMNWKIPIPPIGTQRRIAVLMQKKEKIETLQNVMIALLKEHRAALITVAVAGKVDFRNAFL